MVCILTGKCSNLFGVILIHTKCEKNADKAEDRQNHSGEKGEGGAQLIILRNEGGHPGGEPVPENALCHNGPQHRHQTRQAEKPTQGGRGGPGFSTTKC